MTAGHAWMDRPGQIGFQVGEAGTGQMSLCIDIAAIGRIVQGKAAIEDDQTRIIEALGELLWAEQSGMGHERATCMWTSVWAS
ncbi:hypothetical protein D3C77_489300 [compost metagenome]